MQYSDHAGMFVCHMTVIKKFLGGHVVLQTIERFSTLDS
jgi:hypothetical protein